MTTAFEHLLVNTNALLALTKHVHSGGKYPIVKSLITEKDYSRAFGTIGDYWEAVTDGLEITDYEEMDVLDIGEYEVTNGAVGMLPVNTIENAREEQLLLDQLFSL